MLGAKSKPPLTRAASVLALRWLRPLRSGSLEQPLLQFLLALDAVAGPRHRLQPLRIDLRTAGDALAERSLANPFQRAVHHQQDLALAVALAEQEFLGIGVCRAIGNVLCRLQVGFASVLCRAAHILP